MAGSGFGAAQLHPLFVERLLRHPYTLHTREIERFLAVSVATTTGTHVELTSQVRAEMDAAERAARADDGDDDVDRSEVVSVRTNGGGAPADT